jgi:hypothetical protein
MSKRTVAYIHAGRTQLDAPSATTVIVRKINSYGLGIHHSF